jgi:hypothetical protein
MVTRIKEIIDLETGLDVTINYAHYSLANSNHLAWQTIQTLGYDRNTNEWTWKSGTEGFPVYIDRVVQLVRFVDDADVAQSEWYEWDDYTYLNQTPSDLQVHQMYGSDAGAHPTGSPTYRLEVDTFNGARVEWFGVNADGDVIRGEEDLNFDAYDTGEAYFQARYSYLDTGEIKYGYWIYKEDNGAYPDLDAENKDTYSNPGTFFPFLFFREHKQNLADESLHATDEYTDSRRLAKYYGMDYQDVSDAIHTNPDISDVLQAVAVIGVPMDSTEALDMQYLYDFLKRFIQQNPDTPTLRTNSELMERTVAEMIKAPTQSMRFFDSTFTFRLLHQGVFQNTGVGNTLAVGEFSNETRYATHEWTTRKFVGNDNNGRYVTTEHSRQVPYQVIKKQLSEYVYEEIVIVEPEMIYTVGSGSGGSWSAGGANIGATVNSPDGKVLVPLDKALVEKWTIKDKERIYHRSMWLVFNSSKTVYVKWYQQSWFKAFVTAVAFVILVASFGTGFEVSAALIAAVGVGAAYALTVLYYIALNFIFAEGFKILAKELGADIALIIAVIAVAVGLSQDLGSFNLPFGVAGGEATWAKALLTSANGLIQGSNQVIQDDIMQVQEDIEAFNQYAEEKFEELNEQMERFEVKHGVDPLYFTSYLEPYTHLAEEPQTYYERTIHSGNVGTMAYDYIENFVDISLTLPEIDKTLGG